MNQKKQLQYYAKISAAVQTLFDTDSEHQIDLEELQKDDNLTDFFHCLATRVPQLVYTKLTGQEVDPLEFNHIANRLIIQDAVMQSKQE